MDDRLQQYIHDFWNSATYFSPDNVGANIGLPFQFVSPNNGLFKDQQFYWDTYFTIVGLLRDDRVELAQAMVDNLVFLQSEFGLIPMRNRWYDTGISQIPFLTSMIREVFSFNQDVDWLANSMLAAERELHGYWLAGDEAWSHATHLGLSRYCDHHVIDQTSEHESGWDMTSRFSGQCLNVLPVDLNSCLYRYEEDLAWANGLLGNKEKAKIFSQMAQRRKERMNELLWSDEHSCFTDVFIREGSQSCFLSVANLYPLWAGLATPDQARKSLKVFEILECEWGVANTQSGGLAVPFRQWDYPNAWPNQQFIIVNGLRRYGFFDEAVRVQLAFSSLVSRVFESTGLVWEKYDVVSAQQGRSARYPTQEGFSWTCGVLTYFDRVDVGSPDSLYN